ncbi:BatA domain-containing protein [bacterium]|nr:BatA domain-containing protein [bacterium]
MGFLNPFFLWALPAVLIPVILNILERFSKKGRPFPLLFLLRSKQESRGLSIRDILKLLLRMLIIANLIMIFAHPISGDMGKKRVFVLDNSRHSLIVGKGGVALFERSMEILKDQKQANERVLYLTPEGYDISRKISKIKPVNREWDITLPWSHDDDFVYILISPMTKEFKIPGYGYDLFPEEFSSLSISASGLSIANASIFLDVNSFGFDGEYRIVLEKNGQSRTLREGVIKPGQSNKAKFRAELDGYLLIRVESIGRSDDYPYDNEVKLRFPEKWTYNIDGEFPFVERVISSFKTDFKKVDNPGNAYLAIGGHLTPAADISFYIGDKTIEDTAVFTWESDLPAFRVKASPIEEQIGGESLILGSSGRAFLCISGDKMSWGFPLSAGSISGLNNEDIAFLGISSLDGFIKKKLISDGYGIENIASVHHIDNDLPLPPKRTETRDMRPLLILLFPFLMILEKLL